MPFYDYRCSECQHTFEAMQKFSDEPLVDCPECAAPSLVKLASPSAFVLKGTGWYVTDFKDKGKAPAEKPSEDKPAEGASKQEKPAEASTSQEASSTSETSSSKSSSQEKAPPSKTSDSSPNS